MINIQFAQGKASFFDVGAILQAMDKAEQKALSKIGAYVRTAAQSSLRAGKKPAEPGKPPKLHMKGSPLKRRLFFAFDTSSWSLVVGPEMFQSRESQPVPQTLEEGGSITVKPSKKRTPKDGRPRPWRKQAKRTKDGQLVRNYHPHPFMGPALKKEVAAGHLPAAFGGSLGDGTTVADLRGSLGQ